MKSRGATLSAWLTALALAGCGSSGGADAGEPIDATLDAGAPLDDAGPRDGGRDAQADLDAGDLDAGELDSGVEEDAGAADAGAADAGTDAGVDPCQAAPTDGWSGEIPSGSLATSAPTTDAGLAAVLAALPAAPGAVAVDLAVDGAVVTALGFRPAASGVPNDVWVADVSGGVHVLGGSASGIPSSIAIGDRVAFRARSLDRHGSGAYVAVVEAWSATDVGQPVFVEQAHGRALSYASDGDEVVHTWGELTTDAAACGGSYECFDLTTGSAIVQLRAPTFLGLARGDCVELVIPVLAGPGVEAQLDVRNIEWLRRR